MCFIEHHNLHTPTFPSVNEVVPRGKAVETAISWAVKICKNSPDAVQATKHGLVLGLLRGSIEEAFMSHTWSEASRKTWAGKNFNVGYLYNYHIYWCSSHAQEGLRSFVEVRERLPHRINILTRSQKRSPLWNNPSAKL